MKRGIDVVLTGRLGQFWEWTGADLDLTMPPLTGWLRLSDGLIEVVAAAPEGHPTLLRHNKQAPVALLGVLQGETVLLTEVSSPGITRSGGMQPMLDTVLYRARNMTHGVQNPHSLRSQRLTSASVIFPGLLQWAGYESVRRTSEVDSNSLTVSGQIELLPLPDVPVGRVGNGRSIEVSTMWTTAESKEQVTIGTGLLVGCKTTQPRSAADLADSLHWIQLALVLAYRGWIEATPGSATLDTANPGDSRIRPSFWSSRLMVPPAFTGKLQSLPFFRLRDLGHARGLARWVRLCESNRRIVDALDSFHRNGSASVYDHINAMCSAIEYLAASRARTSGWESAPGDPSGGAGKLHVIARRLGRPWQALVGDVEKWADLTWDAYLNSKHYRPGKSTSIKDLHFLTSSAEIMLTAALLDEAAGTKKVSRHMLAHHELYGLREHLRMITA